MKQEIKTQQQQQGEPDQKVEAHPSHYEPAKHDLKSEVELRAEARDLSRNNQPPEAASNLTNLTNAARRAQPPEDFTGLEVSPASESAGGLPAVVSALKHSWSEMGAARTLKTLARINQKGGFDCPGCAWPEPDGERTHFEFCENGAKHVAD